MVNLKYCPGCCPNCSGKKADKDGKSPPAFLPSGLPDVKASLAAIRRVWLEQLREYETSGNGLNLLHRSTKHFLGYLLLLALGHDLILDTASLPKRFDVGADFDDAVGRAAQMFKEEAESFRTYETRLREKVIKHMDDLTAEVVSADVFEHSLPGLGQFRDEQSGDTKARAARSLRELKQVIDDRKKVRRAFADKLEDLIRDLCIRYKHLPKLSELFAATECKGVCCVQKRKAIADQKACVASSCADPHDCHSVAQKLIENFWRCERHKSGDRTDHNENTQHE